VADGPNLGQDRDIDHDLNRAAIIGGERRPAISVAHLTMNDSRRHARGCERGGDIAGMIERRAEHHRLAGSRLFIQFAITASVTGDLFMIASTCAMSKSEATRRTFLRASCTPTSMTKVRGWTR